MGACHSSVATRPPVVSSGVHVGALVPVPPVKRASLHGSAADGYHPHSLTRPPPSSASDVDEPLTSRERAQTVVSVSKLTAGDAGDEAALPAPIDVKVKVDVMVDLHRGGAVRDVVATEADGTAAGELLTAGSDRCVVRFDMGRRRVLESWKAHSMGVERLLYSQAMRAVFSASRDTRIRLLPLTPLSPASSSPLAAPSAVPVLFCAHTLAVTALSFESCALSSPVHLPSVLISGSRDYSVRWWDIGTQQQTHMAVRASNIVTAIAQTAHASTLQANATGCTHEWDVRTRDVVHTYEPQPAASSSPVVSLSVHPASPCFLATHSSHAGSRMRLYDVRMRRVLRDTAVRDELVAALHMPGQDAAADRIVAASRGRLLSVWSDGLCIARGKLRASGPDSGDLTCMSVGRRDGSVYTGSSNGGVAVWDVRDGAMSVALQTRSVPSAQWTHWRRRPLSGGALNDSAPQPHADCTSDMQQQCV